MQFTRSMLALLCSDIIAGFLHVVLWLMFGIYFFSKCFNNKTDLTVNYSKGECYIQLLGFNEKRKQTCCCVIFYSEICENSILKTL